MLRKTPMVDHFYYNPETLDYNFGPRHPLKPERMVRTLALLDQLSDTPKIAAPFATDAELARVHSPEYIDAVGVIDAAISAGEDGSDVIGELRTRYGFWGDNPPFAGMMNASRAYCGAVIAAARAVRDGAPLAFGIGGGLHHAQRARASGFCIFDDPALAVDVLRERFDRVAYVDIDVHHGDGVQAMFYNDPSVLTCSIHESGRTLYPGTGFIEETGADFTSFNVPLSAKTSGDVWRDAFDGAILPALEAFRPSAIVLQMGTDTHAEDPLGHIDSGQAEWLHAVTRIRDVGLPTVAVGGGGYNLTTVPRMWVSAILTLARHPYPAAIPEELAVAWGTPTISDLACPYVPNVGRAEADAVVAALRRDHIPNLRSQ